MFVLVLVSLWEPGFRLVFNKDGVILGVFKSDDPVKIKIGVVSGVKARQESGSEESGRVHFHPGSSAHNFVVLGSITSRCS